MKTPNIIVKPAPDSGQIKPRLFQSLKPRALALAMGLAASAAFLAGSARADTLISGGTTTIIDPADFNANAGTVTIDNSGTLFFNPTNQGTYAFANNLVLAGAGGTVNLRFQKNDTIYTFNGSITSDPVATGPQTLAIATGVSGNGDREEITFESGIPNVADASPMGLNVNFTTQSASYSFVNLKGNNTFTGPIALVKGTNVTNGYLTIGGRGIGFAGNQYNVTPGTGTLNNGAYAGAISLGDSTLLSYASSVDQLLSGTISGAGSLWKESTSVLTLSGMNTYTGNTTVKGGTLVLSAAGQMSFALTNTAANKITGAGTATLNGKFLVDTSAVAVPTGSWTLVDTTTKSFSGSFGLTGFSGPVGTVFTKVDGAKTWTFDTSTGVLGLTTKSIFTTFAFNGAKGVIDNIAKTILLRVPNGTTPATVAPTFTVTSGTTNRTSGAVPSPAFDGVNPLHYIITDGAFANDYTVYLKVLPPPPAGVGTDLRVWLKADSVDPLNSSQVRVAGADTFVTRWDDFSGYSNDATNVTESQQPRYITSSLNGKPVIRFAQVDDNAGSRLFLGDLSAQFGGAVDTAANSGTGGASLNGAYLNGPTKGDTPALAGPSGKAVSFSGTNQRMLVNYNAALHPAAPWSAEVWLKPAAEPGALQCAISNGQFASTGRSGWLIYQSGSTWNLRTYSGTGTAQVVDLTSAAGTASMNMWHHLVVVNDGTNILFYVDNGAPLSAPVGATAVGTSGGSCLGARADNAFFWPGAADEFAIYPIALNAGDVAAHYTNGNDAGRTTPYQTLVGNSNPVGYYRLEETSGPVLAASIFAVTTLDNDLQYSVFGNRNNDERWVGGIYSEVTPGAFRGVRASFAGVYAQMPHTGSHIFAYESTPAAYRFLLNGTEIGNTTGDYNTGTGLNWVVGNNAAGNGAQLKGDVAELLIYNRVLSPTEAIQVGSYLANKYGLITEYLVAGFKSFGITGSAGVIDNAAKTITLAVPFGTDLATLAPTFTLSSGTCNQTSGLPPSPNFATQNPVTYTVTDGPTVNAYTVTVTMLPETTTYVINLGTSPAGTTILGGQFGKYGIVNLPSLPAGSILRTIKAESVVLEGSDTGNYTSDLAFLIDPTPGTPGGDFSLQVTNGIAPFVATKTLRWANGDDGVGTSLDDTKTDANWTSLGAIDLSTAGIFLGNGYGVAPLGGTWSGKITLSYDIVAAGSPYSIWAGGAAFDTDANGDGVPNGLAWMLGAASPNVNSNSLLPTPGESAGGLTLTFKRVNPMGSATLSVQYSSDLGQTDAWHTAVIPATSQTFGGDLNAVITPGSPTDQITVTIPAAHKANGHLFGRLKATK